MLKFEDKICEYFGSVFYKIYSKQSRISDKEYDLSVNSNLRFHVGADTLNLLLLYELFMFFHV